MSAERSNKIKPGNHLVEATSGNTGIALAMVAAAAGYPIKLIMSANQTEERKQSMRAYGAELILVSKEEGMEGARDLAAELAADGSAIELNQFANQANPEAHIIGTGPEIWRATGGAITHFVSAMGTTGTITGIGTFFKETIGTSKVSIIGCHPAPNAQIPGIRKWPPAYVPAIYRPELVDRIFEITQDDAERTMRMLAVREGIFCGVSSGGAMHAALMLDQELEEALIVLIICDRGDRYLSSGVFA